MSSRVCHTAILAFRNKLQSVIGCLYCSPECVRQSGPGSPWTKLHKYIMRAIEKNKKSPAAKQQPSASSAPAGAAASLSAGKIPPAGSSSSNSHASSSTAARQQQPGAAAVPAPGERQCWGCGFKPGPDQTLQKCGGCRKAVYCSKPCQTGAW